MTQCSSLTELCAISPQSTSPYTTSHSQTYIQNSFDSIPISRRPADDFRKCQPKGHTYPRGDSSKKARNARALCCPSGGAAAVRYIHIYIYIYTCIRLALLLLLALETGCASSPREKAFARDVYLQQQQRQQRCIYIVHTRWRRRQRRDSDEFSLAFYPRPPTLPMQIYSLPLSLSLAIRVCLEDAYTHART